MTYNLSKIGNKLYKARISQGLKQSDVAKMFNMSQSQYSKYENGKKDIPFIFLTELAELYNVPLHWIIDDTDNEFTDEEMLKIEDFKQYIKSIRKKQ